MARKVVNRKEKAAEIEAAAARETVSPKKAKTTRTRAVVEYDEDGVPKKKAPAKRKVKTVEEPRKKLYWGVFSQNLKRVAVFEFDQKDEAAARGATCIDGWSMFERQARRQFELWPAD